jgi:hypothetical protein
MEARRISEVIEESLRIKIYLSVDTTSTVWSVAISKF